MTERRIQNVGFEPEELVGGPWNVARGRCALQASGLLAQPSLVLGTAAIPAAADRHRACLEPMVALLIPSRYVATTQLMPPDNQSGGGVAAFCGGGHSGLVLGTRG